MATKTKSKGTAVVLTEQLIAGTSKHLTNVTQVMLQGGSFTPSQVIERLQTLANLRKDVEAAKAVTKAKLADEKAQTPSLRTFEAALVTFVRAAFGSSPDVLADFGLHPPKVRAPLTVEAKTAAAAKRKATRAARHTQGAKQKAKVKGAVTGILVTPVTAPPLGTTAPAGPSAPAVTGAGATASATPPHAT